MLNPRSIPTSIDSLVVLEIIKLLKKLRYNNPLLRLLHVTSKFSIKIIIDYIELILNISKIDILRDT